LGQKPKETAPFVDSLSISSSYLFSMDKSMAGKGYFLHKNYVISSQKLRSFVAETTIS